MIILKHNVFRRNWTDCSYGNSRNSHINGELSPSEDLQVTNIRFFVYLLTQLISTNPFANF